MAFRFLERHLLLMAISGRVERFSSYRLREVRRPARVLVGQGRISGPGGVLWLSRESARGGLALRPRDLAKIGQLFLNEGEWDGERIVSHDWVTESTRTHIELRGSGGGYGYKWQQMDLNARGETVAYYFMPGYGGNLLAVIPRFDLVVVFTGANYDWDVRTVYNNLLEDYLIPALR